MFAAFTCLVVFLNFPHWVFSRRIVGGYVDHIESVPYTVSIYLVDGKHFCGGSLISSEWVLTAAHCVYHRKPSELKIRIGSNYRNKDGMIREVQQIIMHEQYNPMFSLNYDVAVLRLDQRVSNKQQSVDWIRLADSGSSYYVGMKCLVSGWGQTMNPKETHTRIKSAMLEVVALSVCREMLRPNAVTENMMCAGGLRDDSCQGDSGGPLICDGRLEGIVSWGKGCGVVGNPGVYTYVPSVRRWIYDKTGV
ncbi:AAEL006414-PA [Aedes aegypti]|uniref:trypsin n=2 Tax=Aedes aegypti TaxID=7159 RepID=A0A1S4FDK4_AEDAE|nr:trypsin 3A1-like [Aedes aegypti]EAT42004.1 AAEL006414-PA [Aedes aegypti]